jgi:hypothetical protein
MTGELTNLWLFAQALLKVSLLTGFGPGIAALLVGRSFLRHGRRREVKARRYPELSREFVLTYLSPEKDRTRKEIAA